MNGILDSEQMYWSLRKFHNKYRGIREIMYPEKNLGGFGLNNFFCDIVHLDGYFIRNGLSLEM